MGVYIKGIEMPKEGHLIVRIYANGEVCEPTECVGVWGKVATAFPVPKHGDLTEKNAVFELIRSFPNVDRQLPVEFMKALYELPTVIPAESEGET